MRKNTRVPRKAAGGSLEAVPTGSLPRATNTRIRVGGPAIHPVVPVASLAEHWPTGRPGETLFASLAENPPR